MKFGAKVAFKMLLKLTPVADTIKLFFSFITKNFSVFRRYAFVSVTYRENSLAM